MNIDNSEGKTIGTLQMQVFESGKRFINLLNVQLVMTLASQPGFQVVAITLDKFKSNARKKYETKMHLI